MRRERVNSDVTVIGGGLAGVCAAVSASRLGKTVSLVQNRPVLGGNSSSEVRVWVVGATNHGRNRYARETGIMGELFVENQYRNPDGNPYYWDLTVLETVRAEENISLFLNTDVREVEAEGNEEERTIRSVTGWMMGSEREIRFESPIFLDCTGDGLVGFLAGAKCRMGREARHEYGEAWAPEVADEVTLGSTILFYSKDVGHPVKYVPPSFARDIKKTPILENRVIRHDQYGCHYWWIEWGGEGEHHIIHDDARIRDELWSVIYGIWDYIKNSGEFDADNLTLEWVGSIPGKRECRRFIGDYVLNQTDILEQVPFEDRVAFGGWSIDLHPPEGVYASEKGSKHYCADGVYHIPFRSLYSANVSNLLMAGRDISATHVAFGTTRVMGTCAVVGEAAGTAAALCAEKRISPRRLKERHTKELQQILLRQDASVIGVRNEDPEDLALSADVTASSHLRSLSVEQPAECHPLSSDAGLLFPVDPGVDQVEFLVDAAKDTTLVAELYDTGRPENCVPCTLRAQNEAVMKEGEGQWVAFDLGCKPEEPENAFLVVKANEDVSLRLSHEPVTGVLSFVRRSKPVVDPGWEEQPEQPVAEWDMRPLVRKPFCFRLHPETEAFAPGKVTDGYARPFGGPRMWVSERMDGEEWVELSWEQPVSIQEVHVTFNDDVNEDLINLHHHATPFDVIPELAKDYRIEAHGEDGWLLLCRETDNRKRKRVHHGSTVTADRLRLTVESTNGSTRAEVVEMRAYPADSGARCLLCVR